MIYSKLQISISQAQQELLQLLGMLAGKQKKPPSGNLRIIRNHGRLQYYLVPEGEMGNGRYIPRDEQKIAEAIALRDFFNDVQIVLKTQLTSLEKFASTFGYESLDNLASALHPGRRALISQALSQVQRPQSSHSQVSLPLTLLPQKEFLAQWKAVKYERLPFFEDAPEFFTSAGIRVRSKSEVIIAETLSRFNIPFRYEQPHTLRSKARRNVNRGPLISHKSVRNVIDSNVDDYDVDSRGGITVHPDFTCLNPRTREEFIWEHFGLMGRTDYAHNAVLKIAQYSACGYTLGKNFIATFEDGDAPLSTKLVQNYVENFLL